MLEHIDDFVANGDKYLRVGRMHKLCLLFAGVPGAGKSSLVRAICLKYNRDLYSLALAGMSDAVCGELVSSMGVGGVLLVEDFDSLGFSLSTNRKRSRDEDHVSVSRSGFLNLLDGNMAPPRGTIVCLTANNCTGFDRALVRTGRVDRLLIFGEPQEPEILAALRRLTEEAEGREERFAAFCCKVKKSKRASFSMASLVDFLFRHPTTYLEDFEKLLKSCADQAALSDEGKGTMFA
jgi:ATP-dependent 26S proteasome regulatory subunit